MSEVDTKKNKKQRNERLEARITSEQKELFYKAAKLTGRSVTDFVVSSVQEAAYRTIREHETITLGEHDRKVFVDALLSDKEPSDKLKKAAKSYKNKNQT